jgi:hypothetical protein
MLRLYPFLNKALKVVSGAAEIHAAAVDVTEIAPEETQAALPVIFLSHQLNRVTASVPGHASLQYEISQTTLREFRHAAIIRYTFENCLVHDAGIDVFGGSMRIKKLDGLKALTQPISTLPTALYCMSGVSDQFFGHWLRDAVPTALLAETDESLLLDVRSGWPHARDYVDALGIVPKQHRAYHVEKLTLYQDHGQGSSKRSRYAQIRSKLASVIPECNAGGDAVYLRRGAGGVARRITNEDELSQELAQRGFEVFDLEGASMSDIYQRFRSARVVVSIDGSHVNHLYFSMPKGACLITLVPADRFTMIHVGCASAFGMRYGFVVIDPVEGGYHVPLTDLMKTLDLAARVV